MAREREAVHSAVVYIAEWEGGTAGTLSTHSQTVSLSSSCLGIKDMLYAFNLPKLFSCENFHLMYQIVCAVSPKLLNRSAPLIFLQLRRDKLELL